QDSHSPLRSLVLGIPRGGSCPGRQRPLLDSRCLFGTQARQMFEGEMASLEALQSTGLVRVPRPIKVIDLPGGGAAFVMEHLKMRGLSSQAARLGEQLADLHLHNQKLGEKSKEEESTVGRRAEGAEPRHVTKFGFHRVTCCGFIPQVSAGVLCAPGRRPALRAPSVRLVTPGYLGWEGGGEVRGAGRGAGAEPRGRGRSVQRPPRRRLCAECRD
uniref:protein-ribulosamine 3-kinase n=1 Tax=Neovison vison TaxID=452646 RepID=A0A8C7BWY5_NEOVI